MAVLVSSAAQTTGQAGQPAPTAQAGAAAPAPAPAATEAPAKKAGPYVTKGWSARPAPEPPDYVKTLDKLGIEDLKDIKWLEFGIEQRTRFDYHDDYLRRATLENDGQFLLRSRVYLGIRDIVDPLRFGFEFQDGRQFNSNFPETTREVDEYDILQAFGELYFKDALGPGIPIQFRAGRMTLDLVDRRQVSRSTFGNTTQAFDGFRLRFGEPKADWQIDLLAAQPVERRMTQLDRPDEERWLYGLTGAWRGWSQYVTLEPYYFVLDEQRTDPAAADGEIHSLGMHLFGPIAQTNFDYDMNGAFQCGENGERRRRAWAAYGELGYTFEHEWKPRPSISLAYATGDRSPNDSLDERFNRLYQTTTAYSITELFSWENTISPHVRLEMKPTDKLRLDSSYGVFWLASDTDAWVIPGRRDATGNSGDLVAQELQFRIRYQLHKMVELELGYSHLLPGSFVGNTGLSDDSDFLWVMSTLKF